MPLNSPVYPGSGLGAISVFPQQFPAWGWFWTVVSPQGRLGRFHGGLAGKIVRVEKAVNLQIEARGQARASCWRRTAPARGESARSSL